jgi:hypothetical protein
MSCRERQIQLQEYLAGDLPRQARQGLESHLAFCRDCRADLAAYRALFAALPEMPDAPPAPADLAPAVISRVRQEGVLISRHRESATARVVRRTVAVGLIAAFTIALGAALWEWVARIAAFAGRSLPESFASLWNAAKDMWFLLQLLGDLTRVLEPTALDLWSMGQRVGAPLAAWGPMLLLVYAAALLLGGFLTWRALSSGGERRLGHVS